MQQRGCEQGQNYKFDNTKFNQLHRECASSKKQTCIRNGIQTFDTKLWQRAGTRRWEYFVAEKKERILCTHSWRGADVSRQEVRSKGLCRLCSSVWLTREPVLTHWSKWGSRCLPPTGHATLRSISTANPSFQTLTCFIWLKTTEE